jgi:hypothetical protein
MVDITDIVKQINANKPTLQPRSDAAGSGYFYARQIEAMVQQCIRVFSNFYYMTGANAQGDSQLVSIPCKWGDASRMVANIFKNNSENTALSAPMFAVYIKNFALAPDKRKFPQGEHTMQVSERGIDPTTGRYTDELGAQYRVDRLMSVPYDVTIQVDYYFSNASQQFQVLEQVGLLFNPAIQIQFNENPLDWGATTDMELIDIIYNSRTIPAGTDDSINIMSFTFVIKPFWLNPPAKVKKLIQIRSIVSDIGPNDPDCAGIITWNEGDFQQTVTTIGDNKISLSGNEIVLLGKFGNTTDKDGNIYCWSDLLGRMGHYDPQTTIIRLRPGINIQYSNLDVIGSFVLHPSEANKIIVDFDPDTIPATTIPNIFSFIDPKLDFPGHGISTTPPLGIRYIIQKTIIPNTIAWGAFSAPENSIIEWNGTQWTVVDTLDTLPVGTIVLNLSNNKLYCSTTAGWVLAIEGIYNQGYWRVQFFEDYATQGIQ